MSGGLIYKIQTTREILNFALSNKANYQKVLKDMDKYYNEQCSKLTDGWKGSSCLSTKHPQCLRSCLNQKHFADFVLSLPSTLVGHKLSYRGRSERTGRPGNLYETEIRYLVFRMGRMRLVTNAKGQWEGTVGERNIDHKELRHQLYRSWEPFMFFVLEIGVPLYDLNTRPPYELTVDDLPIGNDWNYYPRVHISGGFSKKFVLPKEETSLQYFPTQPISQSHTRQATKPVFFGHSRNKNHTTTARTARTARFLLSWKRGSQSSPDVHETHGSVRQKTERSNH